MYMYYKIFENTNRDSLIDGRNSIVSGRCHHCSRYQRPFDWHHKTSGNTSAFLNFDWLLIRAQWTVFYPMSRLMAFVTTVICRYVASLIGSTNFHVAKKILKIHIRLAYLSTLLILLPLKKFRLFLCCKMNGNVHTLTDHNPEWIASSSHGSYPLRSHLISWDLLLCLM